MAKHRATTAFVFVAKTWYDASLRHLLGKPESTSTTHSHLLIGSLENSGDHLGLWLKDIPTKALRKDGASTNLRVLIPWSFVIGCGLIEEGEPVKVGFKGQDVTVLR
jgi:hypothetical protein